MFVLSDDLPVVIDQIQAVSKGSGRGEAAREGGEGSSKGVSEERKAEQTIRGELFQIHSNLHFCEQTKQTGGCSCRMRRDAAEGRLAKISGSNSRREERVEARRSRRLQVISFTPTHTHPPKIPLRARDVVGRGEALVEDALAEGREGEGRDRVCRSLILFITDLQQLCQTRTFYVSCVSAALV